jgi:hypothetical protein
MGLTKILEQIVDLPRCCATVLISKNYIIFHNEDIPMHEIFILFDFDGNWIRTYRLVSTNFDPYEKLSYNMITKCIVPNHIFDLYDGFDRWYLPSCILSGKETHLTTLRQLEEKIDRDLFERLCEQNRISGFLMRYWDFDCKVIYCVN